MEQELYSEHFSVCLLYTSELFSAEPGCLVGQMAGTEMLGPQFAELRSVLRALFSGQRAAGGETAAGLRVDRAGDFALDNLDFLVAHLDIGNGNGGKQRLGVGVLRVFKQLFGRSELDALAQIHDGDFRGDMPVSYTHLERAKEGRPTVPLIFKKGRDCIVIG